MQLSKDQVLENLTNQKFKFVYESSYLQFWMKIEHDDKYTEAFIDLRKNENNTEYQLEKEHLLWVPVSLVREILRKHKEDGKTMSLNNIELRKHFVKMMLKADNMGLLDKLCDNHEL